MISNCQSCRSGAIEPAPWQRTGVHRSANTKADLVVTTDEGDRVTISFEAAQELSRASFREPGGDYGIRFRERQKAQSFEAAVSVDGDLSDQERHDIKRLVAGLSKLVHQTDKGDAGGAAKTLAKLASLDSIAQAAFHFEHHESFDSMTARAS